MRDSFDIVVIGAGIAGLTAGFFGARYGHSTLILERAVTGGQLTNAEKIENYPGFPAGVTGADLCVLLEEQASQAGAKFVIDEATGLQRDGQYHVVSGQADQYRANAVVLAGGSHRRSLGIPGEEKLLGRGLSACASCDAPLFEGQVVAVVGGGDTALDEALTLTQYASKVWMLHRGPGLTAQSVLQRRALVSPNIEIRSNTVVEAVLGEERVTGVTVRNTLDRKVSQIDLSGLFVCIGLDPNSSFLHGTLALDGGGHVETDVLMRTSVPGIFAAGDIRRHSVAQTISSAGDGATAAISAHRYIDGLRKADGRDFSAEMQRASGPPRERGQ